MINYNLIYLIDFTRNSSWIVSGARWPWIRLDHDRGISVYLFVITFIYSNLWLRSEISPVSAFLPLLQNRASWNQWAGRQVKSKQYQTNLTAE